MRGAREHNLKGVDLDIPRDALVVFTGVSGSGKSSLAFGTLYAEAQRRYQSGFHPTRGQTVPVQGAATPLDSPDTAGQAYPIFNKISVLSRFHPFGIRDLLATGCGCWTFGLNCSLFVLMREARYTIVPLSERAEPKAIGLTLDEAFVRILALSERQYLFGRVGKAMRLYMSEAELGEPEFESDHPTDIAARRAIKAQVCEHGLGRYRVEAAVQRAPKQSFAA